MTWMIDQEQTSRVLYFQNKIYPEWYIWNKNSRVQNKKLQKAKFTQMNHLVQIPEGDYPW